MYDGVDDPFSDLYPTYAVPRMAHGGRYLTCVVENQLLGYSGIERSPSKTGGPMGNVMLRHLTILGNCLGTTAGLAGAVARQAGGLSAVTVAIVSCGNPAGCLGHADASTDRFGKVAFLQA